MNGYMATKYNASDIFQPASFPEYTYVARQVSERESYESKLRRAIQTKGMLSFITGASKIGKTVLCHKVIGKDNLLEVSGLHIHTVDDFWIQIAEALLLPIEVAQQRSIRQIIEYVIRNNKVVVIDGYHYIEQPVQLSIARILKNEIFYGLRIVIISLPHRSEDVIRLNPDLNGRVRFIHIDEWSKVELAQIPIKGFSLLGLEIKPEVMELLEHESITSPQLMQQMCLNISFDCADNEPTNITSLDVVAHKI